MPTQQDEIINRLDVAFRGYRTKPSDCLSFEVSTETFYIEDNKVLGFCRFIYDTDTDFDVYRSFKIENLTDKLALWPIDGMFFEFGKGPSRCDCVFFNNTHFSFAEFKFNATTSNLQSIHQHREKAIAQLRSTIELINEKFDANSFDYLKYTLEAYLCTPETFPSKNTSISNFAVEFLEEYGISLYEQNYKLF